MAISREPQQIDKNNWYYEMPNHLLLVHEVRNADGSWVCTEQFKVPWRLIEQSRKRRPKPRGKR